MSTKIAPSKIDFLTAALCIAFYACMAWFSKGFVEPDEMSHFMKSMDGLNNWRYVLDIWGRPLCIAYYAIGANFGIHTDRLLSVLASVAAAVGSIRLADQFLPLVPNPLRHYRALLWMLLFAQPYFMLQSFSVMTEILLACLWVWAAVSIAHRRWIIAGFLIGLSGLTRPEGSIAVAAWPLFLILFKNHFNLKTSNIFSSGILAFLPSCIWWLTGIYVFGESNWFITHWPWALQSVYGKTPIEAILAVLNAANFWMLGPIGFGLFLILKKIPMEFELRKRTVILLLIPTGSIFVLHFFLGILGLFGSLSLPRYYITVAPFMAIIAWIGIEGLRDQIRDQKLLPWFMVLVILLIPSRALFMMNRGELPFPKNCDQLKLEYMIQWFLEKRKDPNMQLDPYPENIIAAHPYVNYIFSASSNTPGSLKLFEPNGIKTAPAGTVLIVEDGVWKKNGFPSTDSLRRWEYREVRDTALERQLSDACDNDPLYEDMNIFVKK